MKKDNRPKKQLVQELAELRSQNAELKKTITGSISAELAAEEALRYAESIVETVREPLLVLDAGLKIISANRNFYRTFKVTPGETIGSFIYDLGNKQWDIPRLRELLEETLPKHEAFDDFEVDHNFQDIGHKIMLLNARQIYRKVIGAKMILLAIEDITERKRLEDLLTESEERYKRLFETASDGIVLLEKREGKITQANPATEKILGYTEKDCIGNKLRDIGVLLDDGDFQTTMQNLNTSVVINYRNVKVETKSGQHIDTEIYLVDRAKLIQCNIRDITERKQTKEALRKTEEMYRLVVDNMADVITVMDLNLRFTYVSPSIIRLRGYTAEEVMSQTLEQIMTPESLQVVASVFEEELKLEASGTADPGRTRLLELEEYRKDGSIVWLDNHVSTLRDKEKKLLGIIALSRDITDRKRAEDALRESEEKFRTIFNRASDGILIVDAITKKFIQGNTTMFSMLGYTKEEIESLTINDIHLPKDISHVLAEFEKQAKGEKDLAEGLPVLRKDGSIFYADISASPAIIGGVHCLLGIFRDITERKRAEKQLHDTLESLRKAVGATIQVMVSAIERRDPYTAGHQIRTAALASTIATEMGLQQEKIDGIRMAGSIHDIGKISIPAEILSKPTKLSEIEFSLIKEHARQGYEILQDVKSPWPLAEIVYQHHERMDGSGYPRNLKGDDILMEARIMAVADVVEAMESHRPYRPALGIDAALDEISGNKGTLYDSEAVDACLLLFNEKGYKFP